MIQLYTHTHTHTHTYVYVFFFRLFSIIGYYKVLTMLHLMGNRWGNSGNSVRLYFWGAPKSLQMVIAAMKLKDAYSLEGKL